MAVLAQERRIDSAAADGQWVGLYRFGGVCALIVMAATLLDLVIGSSMGTGASAVSTTALDRFARFHDNWWLGLYSLDLLNVATSLIMLPAIFALFAAHRRSDPAYAGLAAAISLLGTAIFATNNVALPMLTLSAEYAASASPERQALLAAAGEAMLARGAHGNPGAFLGFFLPPVANLIMSWVMLRGQVFGRLTAYLGITGNALMGVYVILVTFAPTVKAAAVAFAAPGGLLVLAWMILFAVRLLRWHGLEPEVSRP